MWRRIPVIIRAPIAGLVVALGSLPWATLAIWNQRFWIEIPWAIVPMALYLWIYWKYLGGAGWPRSTGDARRTSLRANCLTADIWGLSLLAGRHGPITAIVVTGTCFGLGHVTHHPAAVLQMLPYYIGVAAVYGGLAWATNSILPPLVLHAGGDVLSLTRLLLTGLPEWQVSP